MACLRNGRRQTMFLHAIAAVIVLLDVKYMFLKRLFHDHFMIIPFDQIASECFPNLNLTLNTKLVSYWRLFRFSPRYRAQHGNVVQLLQSLRFFKIKLRVWKTNLFYLFYCIVSQIFRKRSLNQDCTKPKCTRPRESNDVDFCFVIFVKCLIIVYFPE